MIWGVLMKWLSSLKYKRLRTGFILFAVSIALNLAGAQLPGLLKIPLFLDNIGTFFAVATIGTVPGMAAAYLGNLFYSFQTPEWLYWGLFGVLMAAIAGRAEKAGRFTRLFDMFRIIPPVVLFTGVIGECFSWVLNGFDLSQGTTAEYAEQIGKVLFLPFPVRRILACCIIEIADKALTLLLSFLLIRLFTVMFPSIHAVQSNVKESPLRKRLVRLITISGFLTGTVVFLLACQSYYHMQMQAGMEVSRISAIQNILTFGGGLFSVALGAEICIVAFAIAYIDLTLVDPILHMTDAMEQFLQGEGGKYIQVDAVTDLEIPTDDELKDLGNAMSITASDIVTYISELNLRMDEINNLQTNIIGTIADIIESRDLTTGEHVFRTSNFAVIIAEQLRTDGKYANEITDQFIEMLRVTAPLHDVGKICVPDAILNKPGRLLPEEYEMMKAHTTLGREIIRKALRHLGSIEYLKMAEQLTEYHHEWWNGKGYPEGLKGNEIPLCARIMAVADVYDALRAERPYKKPIPEEVVFRIMTEEENGIHFDPAVVDAFVHAHKKLEAFWYVEK